MRYTEYMDNFTLKAAKPKTRIVGMPPPEARTAAAHGCDPSVLVFARDTHFNPKYVFPVYGCAWGSAPKHRPACISRLQFLYPTAKEAYYLRQILLHASPYATATSMPVGAPRMDVNPNLQSGYEAARTFEGHQHDTNEQCALAMGLLYDSLTESSAVFDDMIHNNLSSWEMRFAFALMVAYEGFPGRTLLEIPRYRAAMLADFLQTARRNNPLLSAGDAELLAYQDLLVDLAERFTHFGKSMVEAGLPDPDVRPDEEHHWSPDLPCTYYRDLALCDLLDTLPPSLAPENQRPPIDFARPPPHF